MYTLRKITGQGIEMNFNLGNNYTVVDKFRNPEIFKKDIERFLCEKPTSEEDLAIYALISTEHGKVLDLRENHRNFVMTENGKTFSNLSIK